MAKIYAGIGSRRTPEHILDIMDMFAGEFADRGWKLRSGGAVGADTAFQQGVEQWAASRIHYGDSVNLRDYQEIFLPWNGFCGMQVNEHKGHLLEHNEKAFEIAKQYHPAWDKLSNQAKALMARNSMQVLGKFLDSPVKFVICWTPDGAIGKTTKDTGGTGQAIRIAFAYDIPIFNLADEEHLERIDIWLNRWP
jgi:hypothetical protein